MTPQTECHRQTVPKQTAPATGKERSLIEISLVCGTTSDHDDVERSRERPESATR